MIKRLLLAVTMLCVPNLAQVPVSPATIPHVTFVDATGSACSGCSLSSFSAGTTTPLATYVDSTGTGQNTNPITLDAAGGANIWLGANAYKFVLKDSLGATIWTVDNVQGYISACSTSGCTFTGPISGTTATFDTVTANTTFTGPIGKTSPDAGDFTTVTGKTVNNVAYPTTFNELQGDVTACASNPCTVAINSTIAIPSNYTVPSNVTLVFSDGAQLQPASGITLTVSGPVQAAAGVQIFGGAGSIAGLTVARPEWFGGVSVSSAYNALSSAGGTIYLGLGTWQSGGFQCTVPNVTIIGSARPGYNSGYTALTGGTIIQGTVNAYQGCDHFTLRNLGVDVGPNWVSSGNPVSDAIGIFNLGSVVGAAPLDGVLIDNVSCLGPDATSAVHCIAVENVKNSMIHNVTAVYAQHGIVLKGMDSHIDGFWSAGHHEDSVIVKSDIYAPTARDTVTNGAVTYLLTPGDTRGGLTINAQNDGGDGSTYALHDVTASNIQFWGVGDPTGSRAVLLEGAHLDGGITVPVTDVILSNLTIDWPTASPTNISCITLSLATARVSMNNIRCRNVYSGINATFPDLDVMGQIQLTNSFFQNIQTNAVYTYGDWVAYGNICDNVTTNCFDGMTGNTHLGINTVTNSGAYFNHSVGNTFQFDYRQYMNGALNLSPGEFTGASNAVGGILNVSFSGQTFTGPPICYATIVDPSVNVGGSVPQVWVVAETTTSATFNTSDASYTGEINWSCRGLLQ